MGRNKFLFVVPKNQYTWKFHPLHSITFICSRSLSKVLGNNLSLETPVKTCEGKIFWVCRCINSKALREKASLKNLPETLLKMFKFNNRKIKKTCEIYSKVIMLSYGAECNMGIFSKFPIFWSLFWNKTKYEKRGKYLPILHAATCDNYIIVKCLLKSNTRKATGFKSLRFNC